VHLAGSCRFPGARALVPSYRRRCKNCAVLRCASMPRATPCGGGEPSSVKSQAQTHAPCDNGGTGEGVGNSWPPCPTAPTDAAPTMLCDSVDELQRAFKPMSSRWSQPKAMSFVKTRCRLGEAAVTLVALPIGSPLWVLLLLPGGWPLPLQLLMDSPPVLLLSALPSGSRARTRLQCSTSRNHFSVFSLSGASKLPSGSGGSAAEAGQQDGIASKGKRWLQQRCQRIGGPPLGFPVCKRLYEPAR